MRPLFLKKYPPTGLVRGSTILLKYMLPQLISAGHFLCPGPGGDPVRGGGERLRQEYAAAGADGRGRRGRGHRRDRYTRRLISSVLELQ